MHSLQGFIAIENVAREFEHSYNEGNPPAAKAIGLPQGFGLVPMTEQLRARMVEVTDEGEETLAEFSELTESAVWVANMLSQVGKVAYIETESGDSKSVKSAIVWEFGQVVYGPTKSDSENPVNEALKSLGVALDGADSEFEVLGLGEHSSTQAWYEAALKYELEVDPEQAAAAMREYLEEIKEETK